MNYEDRIETILVAGVRRIPVWVIAALGLRRPSWNGRRERVPTILVLGLIYKWNVRVLSDVGLSVWHTALVCRLLCRDAPQNSP